MAKLIESAVPAVTIAATADQNIGEAPEAGRVTSVTYTPEAAVTGAASPDSRTLSLVNKGQSGSGSTVVASLALVADVNLAAFDEKAITVTSTAADKAVVAGDVLAWVSTAVTGGGGLVDPGGHVRVEIGDDAYSEPSGGAKAQTQA